MISYFDRTPEGTQHTTRNTNSLDEPFSSVFSYDTPPTTPARPLQATALQCDPLSKYYDSVGEDRKGKVKKKICRANQTRKGLS